MILNDRVTPNALVSMMLHHRARARMRGDVIMMVMVIFQYLRELRTSVVRSTIVVWSPTVGT